MLPDLHTNFSRGRSGGLVFPSLSEFSTFIVIHTVKAGMGGPSEGGGRRPGRRVLSGVVAGPRRPGRGVPGGREVG